MIACTHEAVHGLAALQSRDDVARISFVLLAQKTKALSGKRWQIVFDVVHKDLVLRLGRVA